MKIQESAENYLESILMVKEEKGNVRAIDIVNKLNFSKPSVSVAMKQLEENGYIQRDAAGNISLLPPGKEIAEKIYERHNALAKILVAMGVNEKTAREDACKIEHDISDETFTALINYCSGLL